MRSLMKPPRPRHTPGQMNRLEERYSEYLRTLFVTGIVEGYEFEPIKFRLAQRCFYTPDFMIIHKDHISFIDVKGHIEDDSLVKLKTVATKYPWFEFGLVTFDRRAGWKHRYFESC